MTDSTVSEEMKTKIGPILGKTPSGVFILTASDGEGSETGMLASWVQQAAFEPPMVSVAVNGKRYLTEWLQKSPKAAISLVGKDQSGAFFKHFGKGFEPGEEAFDGISISRGETGLPLLSDAIGSLEGTVVASQAAGDHVVYFLRVENAVEGGNFESGEPFVHIRKNGFHY